MPEHVRRGDVHDVRRERLHLVPLPLLQRRSHLVLAAAGHGDVRHVRHVVPLVRRRLAEVALDQVGGHDKHPRVRARPQVVRQTLHRAAHAVDVLPDGREDDHAALGAVPQCARAAVADDVVVVQDGNRLF